MWLNLETDRPQARVWRWAGDAEPVDQQRLSGLAEVDVVFEVAVVEIGGSEAEVFATHRLNDQRLVTHCSVQDSLAETSLTFVIQCHSHKFRNA